MQQRQHSAAERACNACACTGPPGCGKSTLVGVLAAEAGRQLVEWQAPVPTLWQEHSYHGVRPRPSLHHCTTHLALLRSILGYLRPRAWLRLLPEVARLMSVCCLVVQSACSSVSQQLHLPFIKPLEGDSALPVNGDTWLKLSGGGVHVDPQAGRAGGPQYASKLDDFEAFVAHAKLASLSLQRSAPALEAAPRLSQPRLQSSQQGSQPRKQVWVASHALLNTPVHVRPCPARHQLMDMCSWLCCAVLQGSLSCHTPAVLQCQWSHDPAFSAIPAISADLPCLPPSNSSRRQVLWPQGEKEKTRRERGKGTQARVPHSERVLRWHRRRPPGSWSWWTTCRTRTAPSSARAWRRCSASWQPRRATLSL